jgi:VCBS repeat protein
MHSIHVRRLGTAVLCWVAGASVACSAATPEMSLPRAAASEAAPAETPIAVEGAPDAAESLAQFYGFGEMEILKLQHRLGLPKVLDINGDGLNDIVLTNNRKARVELLLQKRNFDPDRVPVPSPRDDDVNDLFGREETWRFQRAALDLDVEATDLVAADLNNDGLIDLAYASKEGLFVACQQAPEAAEADKDAPREPRWLPARKFELRGGKIFEGALASGDLNGDGLTDLAWVANKGTFVLTQQADGLAAPVKHHAGNDKILRLLIADLDANGRDDLALRVGDSDFPLRVRFQTAAGQLGPEMPLSLSDPQDLDAVELGGKARLLSLSRHSGRVQIWGLAVRAEAESFPALSYPLPDTESPEHRDLIDADLNGDGLRDLVVSDPSLAEFLVYLAGKEASLNRAQRFPGLTDMRKLCAASLDGDRREAIVALSVKEKLIGVTRLTDGRLSFPKSVRVQGAPVAMDVADLDGDGTDDLACVAEDEDDQFFLRVVTRVGRADEAPGAELALEDVSDRPHDLRVIDVDQDGLPDVLIVRPYGPLMLVRQVERGKFEAISGADLHAGLVANVSPEKLALAPLGANKAPAILLARKTFARALTFENEKGWQVIDQYPSPDPQGNVAAASTCVLPGEDDLSILVYDAARGRLAILTRQEDGTYGVKHECEIGRLKVRKILAGNFGGASSLSVVVCGQERFVRVPLAERTFELRKIASFEPDIKGGRYGSAAVGDVNRDGVPDVLLCEHQKRHLEILTFDQRAKLVSAMKFKVFEQPREVEQSSYRQTSNSVREPRAVAVGDVTGDGKDDVVLLVHDRLIVYPQD